MTRYFVSAEDPRDDFGEKTEDFGTPSAAEVYGRKTFGVGNYFIRPIEVKEDYQNGRKAA